MSLAGDFEEILAALPPDWTDLEVDLRIDDERQYVDSAVALSQVNAQPYSHSEWHWRLLVAHSFGHAAAAETVEGVLAKLDAEGVSGEMRVGLANPLPGPNRSEPKVHLLDADGASLILYWNETGMGLRERSAFTSITVVDSLDEAVHLERAVAPDTAPSAWVSAQRSSLPQTDRTLQINPA